MTLSELLSKAEYHSLITHEEYKELKKQIQPCEDWKFYYNHGYAQARKDVLDKIKEEIRDNTYYINELTEKEGIDFKTVEEIIDKYKGSESE